MLDENGKPCAPGVVGRLAVKGPTGCRYLADERQKDYVQNGWNLTGDAYVMDEDGYFFYQARTDDMIISAGYNIAGPEVEGALLAHPAVAECGVVGAPDEERGMIVKAFVVLKNGLSSRRCDEERRCRTTSSSAIAPYKYPRAIEFVDALPRTETGKLQRFKLRTRHDEDPATARLGAAEGLLQRHRRQGRHAGLHRRPDRLDRRVQMGGDAISPASSARR